MPIVFLNADCCVFFPITVKLPDFFLVGNLDGQFISSNILLSNILLQVRRA